MSTIKKILLNIGDVIVSTEPVMFETVLGSCVSVCLWDKNLMIGGINHYMLPRPLGNIKNPLYFGAESIEKLVDDFLQKGSSKPSLVAKVFGGCNVVKGLSQGFDIGRGNVRIAKKTLNEFGIPIVREFTGHDRGIKVMFHSSTGKVFIEELRINR